MKTTLCICETCRYSAEQADWEGHRGGVWLAEHIQSVLEETDCKTLQLRRFRCLMACNRHCTVSLQASGKMGYVIGDFPPTHASALTLVTYAHLYHDSEDGVVPYRTWPEAIRGHFVARLPPLDLLDSHTSTP